MKHETIAKLIELQMKQFDSTRDTKTKINIALWTFLAVTAGLAMTHAHPKPVGCWVFLEVAPFLALAGFHVVWMIGIQRSLDFDKYLWVEFRKMLDKSEEDKIPDLQDPPLKVKWVLIESGVTMVFISFALAALLFAGGA